MSKDFHSVRSFLLAIGVKAERLDVAVPPYMEKQSSTEIYYGVKCWLRDPLTRRFFTRAVAVRSFAEMTREEQQVFQFISKDKSLGWLSEHVGVTVSDSKPLNSIALFKGMLLKDEFDLPLALRSELLKVINRFE